VDRCYKQRMSVVVPLLLALASPSAPADDGAATELPKVLLLSLEAAGVAPEEAKILDGMIANAMAPYESIEVVTSDDLAQMMELEGQRQQLGCDTSSCLAEIAGAMGARYVVFGNAGRLGELFVVQLNLFDSVEAKAVERREMQAAAIEELAPQVRPAVAELLTKVTDETVDAPDVATATAGGGPGPLLLTGGGTAAAGGVLLGVSGVMWAIGALTLDNPESDRNGKDAAVNIFLPGAIGTAVVGGVALVGGGALALVALGVE
jgi:hypothetical protein